MAEPLDSSVERAKELILAKHPDTKFKLEAGGHEGIYHLSIYSSEGRLALPIEVTEYLNQVWREHKLTLITTVYSMEHYTPHPAAGEGPGGS